MGCDFRIKPTKPWRKSSGFACTQFAVLEERNQLAAEIHDALAQSFTARVAGEQLAAREGDPLSQIQRANEIAKFGFAV
jgi:signal transduction histidine kinase